MFFNISFIHLHKLSNICVVFLPVEYLDIPTVLTSGAAFQGYVSHRLWQTPRSFLFCFLSLISMLSVQSTFILVFLPSPGQTSCSEQIMNIISKLMKGHKTSKNGSKVVTVENILDMN